MYKFKDYSDGNIEVEEESLKGTSFKYLAVRCTDPIMLNMTDAELKEDDEKYDGDGREMKFNIFVGYSYPGCLSFNFNLYGIDVNTTLNPAEDPIVIKSIQIVLAVVNDYFKDKTIQDISEAFYKKFENEILGKILDYDSKRIA